MALDDVLQEQIDEGLLIDESDSEKVRQWIQSCIRVIRSDTKGRFRFGTKCS